MSSIVSEFYGMQILMPRSKDNSPYFEVHYAGKVHHCSIVFPYNMLTKENLSPTAQEAIRDWARQHTKELQENWNRIGTPQPFSKIKPIE